MNACAVVNDTLMPTKLGLRILIVDDDIDLLESIYDLLELEDDSFVIQTASDYDSAIIMAESFQPNLALLDIKLGTASGIDLVPILKSTHPDTACIMMTAFRDSQYAVDALRSGADDFLYKPVEPELLFKTIRHYQTMQETLRENHLANKRFYSIFEHSYDHLFILDPLGKIIDVNKTALSFYNLNKEDVVDSFFAKATWWDPLSDNLVSISNTMNSAIKGELCSNEFSIQHSNGTKSIFEFTLTPVFDDNGHVLMIIPDGRDVTDRIKEQNNIIYLNQSLEQRVSERTKELEAARDEAEEANQAKSEFLSQMSHELRTPMNAILGFTQLIETNDAEPLQPTQQECIKEISGAGKHLMTLINQVLDLARIEANQFEVDLKPISVPEIIDKALSLTRPLSDQRMLSVDNTILVNDITYVIADQQTLLQVVINLLSNAVKYNHQQGRIKLYTEPTKDGYLRINVQDTGVGIPKDKYDAVFASFERIANSQNVDGAGIGLNVSKHMVEAMDGRIGFDSVEDEGSCFWIELKLTKKPESA